MEDKENQLLGIGSRIKHPAYGDGVITKLFPIAYQVCFILHGLKEIGKNFTNWEIIEHIESKEEVTFSKAEHSLMTILRKWGEIQEIVPLGDKWKNGKLILKPADDQLKAKEIPIDTFFHKIVMVRDRVRVMEQRINSSKNLSDEEKVNLQQYITRIYGSLTTFNVLFKHRKDGFRGSSS